MLPPPGTSTSVVLAPFVLATQLGATPAEPEVRPVASLSVKSSPGCVSRAELIAGVLSRAPNVDFVAEEAALDIRVQVDATQTSSVVSEVTLSRRGRQPSTRRVVAASCSEASEALAVIIAIALGKSTSHQSESVASENGSTESPGGTQRSSDASLRTGAAGSSRENRERAREVDAGKSGEFETTRSRSVEWRPHFALQLAGDSFVAPAPGVMIGVGVRALAGVDTASIWSPALVLGAARAWRSGVEARGGTASFTLDAATLDACALRFALASVETRWCAFLLGGRLSAEGSDTFNAPGTVARPFWVVGTSASFTASVGSRFEMTARLAAGVNLVRDEFKFDPVVFYEVPAITLAPSIGFGARFP